MLEGVVSIAWVAKEFVLLASFSKSPLSLAVA
ncbi:hypothetical protein CTRC69_00835 [Chlamydia trachomatis RC-F/69]|nr:hypothetical protein E150_00835 [Chlamydia trachomatis E/150]ADH18767.1 hypothetical protein G11222_00815 [Chlamydia trachomatis G/11222]ADH20618.1 hypothetical protein E11023_00825 [Chlamydia trachomatis E/11023]AGR93575.1 hypothetical protein CTRC69_00835 [Chlamydia trachomatis RC-F/69]AGR95418.1 hypothetical protein CTRC852_00855 [Chlamydia trachomatis RC-F(s)/852]AGR99136.1 hypothetical protein CTRC342_00850 [Chlamydia trachomatis RC-F(s)/342]